MCYYIIPKDCIQAIAGAKKSVSFTIYVPNRKPDTITFSEERLPEIKNIIINGHFSNYLDDLNKLTEKRKKNKNRAHKKVLKEIRIDGNSPRFWRVASVSALSGVIIRCTNDVLPRWN